MELLNKRGYHQNFGPAGDHGTLAGTDICGSTVFNTFLIFLSNQAVCRNRRVNRGSHAHFGSWLMNVNAVLMVRYV